VETGLVDFTGCFIRGSGKSGRKYLRSRGNARLYRQGIFRGRIYWTYSILRLPDVGLWTLDPIDGTSGFLRGGQYAVCLALVEDGDVKVGVLSCPNLPLSFGDESSERGVLLYGIKGDKAYQTSLRNPTFTNSRICQMRRIEDLSKAVFCESVEAGHSSHDQQSQIAKLLGIRNPSIRMDSQAKYATLTRGDADIYLRLPVRMSYEEKIWV
jgi:3'(2'), 5'-bisphosphate nucleotidase